MRGAGLNEFAAVSLDRRRVRSLGVAVMREKMDQRWRGGLAKRVPDIEPASDRSLGAQLAELHIKDGAP